MVIWHSALTRIANSILLFTDPVVLENTAAIPNITTIPADLAFHDFFTSNLTTLSASISGSIIGVISGLLYVPTLASSDPCNHLEKEFVWPNVTRRANLPPTNYKLIALAPWFNNSCSNSYLNAAGHDPIYAFIFYLPASSDAFYNDPDNWGLQGTTQWGTGTNFPVFAISSFDGSSLMDQLSLYSGAINTIPNAAQIRDIYHPQTHDYARVWTELTLESTATTSVVATNFIIVIATLVFAIIAAFVTMHYIYRRQCSSLRRRVLAGEVDLEAMGIKRLTVPASHVGQFPISTYQAEVASHPAQNTTFNADASQTPIALNATLTTNTSFSFSQPHCHICHQAFRPGLSVVKQLSCHHVFHMHCIDEYLTKHSSLCPKCKLSMLPLGYCPKITISMVRRERAIRRLLSRVDAPEPDMGAAEDRQRKVLSTSKSSRISPVLSQRAISPDEPAPIQSSVVSTTSSR